MMYDCHLNVMLTCSLLLCRCVRLNFYRQGDKGFERIRGAFCDDSLYKLTFTFTFNRGSACCRSGWWLVCCCFIERSAHSSFYFVTHRTVLGLGDTNLCWQPSVTLERHLFKEMYWYIVQLRSVNCFSKINVKWLTATVWRIREKIITAALLCAELCTTVIFFIRFWYLRCCGCPWNWGRQHL